MSPEAWNQLILRMQEFMVTPTLEDVINVAGVIAIGMLATVPVVSLSSWFGRGEGPCDGAE